MFLYLSPIPCLHRHSCRSSSVSGCFCLAGTFCSFHVSLQMLSFGSYPSRGRFCVFLCVCSYPPINSDGPNGEITKIVMPCLPSSTPPLPAAYSTSLFTARPACPAAFATHLSFAPPPIPHCSPPALPLESLLRSGCASLALLFAVVWGGD